MKKLSVMISSTMEDLGPEREAVDQAIQNFHFERFRAEALGARSSSPRDICDEMANKCDLFILIFGEKYGFIINDLDISVTHREYNVARADNPQKILVYEKKVPNREPRAIKFLKEVSDFDKGYFLRQFQSKDDLFNGIKEDIAVWITERIKSKDATEVQKQKIGVTGIFTIDTPKEVEVSEAYVEVTGSGATPGNSIILMTSLHGLYLAPQEKEDPIADKNGLWKHGKCHLFNPGKRWIYALDVMKENKNKVLELLRKHGQKKVENSMYEFEKILRGEKISYQITPAKPLMRRF